MLWPGTSQYSKLDSKPQVSPNLFPNLLIVSQRLLLFSAWCLVSWKPFFYTFYPAFWLIEEINLVPVTASWTEIEFYSVRFWYYYGSFLCFIIESIGFSYINSFQEISWAGQMESSILCSSFTTVYSSRVLFLSVAKAQTLSFNCSFFFWIFSPSSLPVLLYQIKHKDNFSC